jgi:hypothetical protein
MLATPPTVTTTLPVVAALGTGATMLVADQLVGVAVVPLNFTVLLLWEAPKPDPAMVTAVPASPDVGDKPVMLGAVADEAPVPVSVIICGLPPALSVMVIEPFRVPVVVGVKVTLIVQTPLIPSELGQELAAKSPVGTTL